MNQNSLENINDPPNPSEPKPTIVGTTPDPVEVSKTIVFIIPKPVEVPKTIIGNISTSFGDMKTIIFIPSEVVDVQKRSLATQNQVLTQKK